MPVTLFIQERSGDFNLEQEFTHSSGAHHELHSIRSNQGYWVNVGGQSESDVFIPWHRIDRITIRKDK